MNSFKLIFQGNSGKLHEKPPPTSLISVGPLMSILSQVIVTLATTYTSLELTKSQPWYYPYNNTEDFDADSFYENFSIFSTSQFIYIILAIWFSKGFPYRKPFYTNFIILLQTILQLSVSAYLTVYPAVFVQNFMELKPPPEVWFRGILLVIGFCAMIWSLLAEIYFVDFFYTYSLYELVG